MANVGDIVPYAGLTAPTGTAFCDGTAVSRTGDYASLWDLLHIDDSGVKTSGSAIITGLSDTSNMVAGYNVEGSGIPSSAIIQSVDSATQITLSQNCTASETSAILVSPYNLGDGSTTWNLPDLRGQTVIGAGDGEGASLSNRVLGQTTGSETHTLTESEMPSHNHEVTVNNTSGGASSPSGNYLGVEQGSLGIYDSASTSHTLNSATIQNTGSGNAHNNMQPSYVLNYYIVYSVPTSTGNYRKISDLTEDTDASTSAKLLGDDGSITGWFAPETIGKPKEVTLTDAATVTVNITTPQVIAKWSLSADRTLDFDSFGFVYLLQVKNTDSSDHTLTLNTDVYLFKDQTSDYAALTSITLSNANDFTTISFLKTTYTEGSPAKTVVHVAYK